VGGFDLLSDIGQDKAELVEGLLNRLGHQKLKGFLYKDLIY
jgi:hypothetical protein